MLVFVGHARDDEIPRSKQGRWAHGSLGRMDLPKGRGVDRMVSRGLCSLGKSGPYRVDQVCLAGFREEGPMECEVRSSGFLMHSDTQNLGSSICLDSNPSPITSKFYDLRLLNFSEPWFPSL